MASYLTAEELSQAMNNPNSLVYKKLMDERFFTQLDIASHEKILAETLQRLILSDKAEREQMFRELQQQELAKQEYYQQLSQEQAAAQKTQADQLEQKPLETLLLQLAEIDKKISLLDVAIADNKIQSRTNLNAFNAEIIVSLNRELKLAGLEILTEPQQNELKQRLDRAPTADEVMVLRPDLRDRIVEDKKAIPPVTEGISGIAAVNNMINMAAVLAIGNLARSNKKIGVEEERREVTGPALLAHLRKNGNLVKTVINNANTKTFNQRESCYKTLTLIAEGKKLEDEQTAIKDAIQKKQPSRGFGLGNI